MSWYEKKEEKAAIPSAKALWAVCPKCMSHMAKATWKANGGICPKCNYHGRLSARERIAQIADEGTFSEVFRAVSYSDHLDFHDATGDYKTKVEATIAKTGETESIVMGTCEIAGRKVMLGVMDFAFMGGSLGTGTGERIARACEQAIAERRALVIFSASGGARMHEGILSLMQMAKTSAAIGRLKEAGLAYISVLTDPTTGGVSASYAMLGDINITEPRALIGFAGRRVIENTIHQKLPADFQSAEYLEKHGFIDRIVERKDLKAFIAKMLGYWDGCKAAASAAAAQEAPAAPASAQGDAAAPQSAMDRVKLARDPGRPHLKDFIENVLDDFEELHGDRLVNDDRGLVGGFGTLGRHKVLVLGHNKGETVEENMAANFGMANPDGYRKAMRLAKLAERFGNPIVTFVDTPGAYPGKEAEERGQAEAIAKSLEFFALLKTPIVVVVTGEGGSGGALAIAVGDKVLMLENAIYSVISPEGCAGILWRDGAKAPEAAEALKITAADLKKLGAIDEVVPEPPGGAQKDRKAACAAVKRAVLAALDALDGVEKGELVERRYARLRSMGNFA